MIIETITSEQKEFAARLVSYCNFGKRGKADGSKSEQETGILGQTFFADLIGEKRPEDNGGFDGGFDFIINGRKVDVKTMGRTVAMQDSFVHNFVASQRPYDCEYYVFLSHNKRNDNMTICGYIDKEGFFEKAKFCKEGTKRYRDDGTYFVCKADMYEIKQTYLFPVNSLEELLAGIK